MKLSNGVKIAIGATAFVIVSVISFIVYKKITVGSKVKKGQFDWVGAADYGDRQNYYAGVHIMEFMNADINVGDTLEISGSNWAEMEGKTAKVLKLTTSATAVLDVPVPNSTENIFGYWKNLGQI